MKASRMIAFALAAGALHGAPAASQALQDPTEPPASMLAPLPSGTAAAPVASGPQLQSILMAKGGGARRVAVIDGQTLRLGDSYKGARLVSMTETQVVLRRGSSEQVIKLFPSSESKPVNKRLELAQP